ncbi:fimbrial protein, partial [Obesumbacterium proteus]|uniref:fimbrial protein n=1 Tax=Obesumbacterium proteus TaxID=82983 RepID=UPI00242ED11C
TAVPFTIQLNKCSPNISTAGVTFNGTQFGSDPTQLALTDTSGSGDLAVGVVVQVLDNNGPIALNSVNETRYALHAGDNNKLPFSLRYQATQIPVKPGNGSAVLYFSMDYQ